MKLLKHLVIVIKIRVFCYEWVELFTSSGNKLVGFSNANIRPTTKTNLTDILNFQPARYFLVFRNLLALGGQGYYAYLDNKCVYRSWVKLNEQGVYPHWAYPMKLQPNQHFFHYCETARKLGAQIFTPAVLSKIVDDYKDKGKS